LLRRQILEASDHLLTKKLRVVFNTS